MDWAKTNARRDEKHLSFEIWCPYIRGLTVYILVVTKWHKGKIPRQQRSSDKHQYDINLMTRLIEADPRVFVIWVILYNGLCVDGLVKQGPDVIIKWKHFLCYWPFVQGIHRSPVNSPHKGQWCGALMFSLICTWMNGWVNNREAGVLRCHHAHNDITIMVHGASSHRIVWLQHVKG